MSLLATVAEWAQFSPADEFWAVTIGSLIASTGGFIGGFRFLHRKRTFENIPTSRIRSAAQGYVELEGKGMLMEGPPIHAPLTGIRCTWYCYNIRERRGSGKNARWVTIEQGTSDELFLLIDDTGKCVIDPEGASVIPAVTDKWYGSTGRPQGGSKVRRGIFFGGKFRYTEMRMHPGDTLYATGLFKTVGGASTELNVNAELVQLLKEWKADSERLLRNHDHNRDGQIDMHEWEQVRNAALQEVLSHHQEVRTTPAVNLLGKTQDARHPYILSAIPQHRLIRRYHHYSVALISLFFIAGILACWLLGLRYYH